MVVIDRRGYNNGNRVRNHRNDRNHIRGVFYDHRHDNVRHGNSDADHRRRIRVNKLGYHHTLVN